MRGRATAVGAVAGVPANERPEQPRAAAIAVSFLQSIEAGVAVMQRGAAGIRAEPGIRPHGRRQGAVAVAAAAEWLWHAADVTARCTAINGLGGNFRNENNETTRQNPRCEPAHIEQNAR